MYDDEDEWSDDEPGDEYGDVPDDAPSETVACPRCGADVYEDAERCPACREWIVHGTSALEGRPGWYVALGLLGVIAVVVVLSGLWRLVW